jgi:hypothetical protein
MSDNPEGMYLHDDDDSSNPYLGWNDWDEEAFEDDPYDKIEREVMDSLGIESFESILLDPTESEIENMRGNRFSSLEEAILYLFDAGILQFSGIVINQEEIEIEVESNTGRSNKR